MRYVINQFRPLYYGSISGEVRLGDHPGRGTRIEHAPKQVVDTLAHFKEPMQREAAVHDLSVRFGMTVSDVDSLVQQLIDVGYLIDADALATCRSVSGRLLRESRYFAMQGDYKTVPAMLEKLKSAHALVLGVGGIGTIVAETLARAGVGRITLVDDDCVEESNLIRQTLFSSGDVGQSKVEAAARSLERIVPDVEVFSLQMTVTPNSIPAKVLRSADVVIATLDRPTQEIRLTVNRMCVTARLPVIFAGFNEHVGIVGPLVIPGETACYQCLLSQIGEFEGYVMNEGREIPSYGPLCLAIGAVASDEVIRLLSGYASPSLKGASLMIDMDAYSTKRQGWERVVTCPVCST